MCSESVSKALLKVCGEKAYETATFVSLMDKFFDTLNVHNYSGGSKALKPFQAPFRSPDDFRIKVCNTILSTCMSLIVIIYIFHVKWLENTFLAFLSKWETSVKEREGFSNKEKSQMLLSHETLYGIHMTCK